MNRKADITLGQRLRQGALAWTVASFTVCSSEMNGHVMRPDFDSMFGIHPPHKLFLLEGKAILNQHAEYMENVLILGCDGERTQSPQARETARVTPAISMRR